MSLTGSISLRSKPANEMSSHDDSPETESLSDWMDCAIPVDGAAAITAAAAGFVTDNHTPHFSPKWNTHSPESATASEASDFFHVDRNGRKNMLDHDDCASETLSTQPDSSERVDENYENGHISPEYETPCSRVLERIGSCESFFRY